MSKESHVLGGHRFARRMRIRPETDSTGGIQRFMPQEHYARKKEKRLNLHGSGPFCRFSVPGLPAKPGVYGVTVNDEAVYIGKARDIAERWGPRGYGSISPANCYEGGQATNCKVNHRILLAVQRRRLVEVWISEVDNPDRMERQLIHRLKPRWNGRIPL